jgi:transcriptional regulator with XRE-family HTH domain
MFTPEGRTLLEIVVAERNRAGVTQRELARRLGKPQPWVSFVENGVRRLDLLEFCAVIRALDGDPELVFEAFVSRLPAHFEI